MGFLSLAHYLFSCFGLGHWGGSDGGNCNVVPTVFYCVKYPIWSTAPTTLLQSDCPAPYWAKSPLFRRNKCTRRRLADDEIRNSQRKWSSKHHHISKLPSVCAREFLIWPFLVLGQAGQASDFLGQISYFRKKLSVIFSTDDSSSAGRYCTPFDREWFICGS